eukprot:TRINITY_DN4410_c0_g1_i1.p1 TRINITY_DN4410_c0_g1~~TRINITY_DN4410_c0_g1_i1.p1  ORF type:complete len:614 (-),score=166.43 TRINITY_DN4410_c0_g1_i1:744-2585(-)
MDPMGEEELDYEDEDFGQKKQFQTVGAIAALAEEEVMPDDEDYDDLYQDVNVGEGFMQTLNNRSFPDEVQNGNVVPEGLENEAESQNVQDIVKEEVGEKDVPSVTKATPAAPAEGSVSVANARNQGIYGETSKNMSVPEVIGEKVEDFGSRGPGKALEKVVEQNRGQNRVNLNQNRVGSGNDNSGLGGRHSEGGNTLLFIGELHWWTTDAELEAELNKYGQVKELKFYDEKASGKSKGYCHVEFFEASAAAACKHGMDGHVFNGRACVVDFATPNSIRQMGAAQGNKAQQGQNQGQNQQRRMMNDGGSRGGGGSYQGGDNGRNFNKMGNWGRSGQGGGNRGQSGQGRGRGGKNMGGGNNSGGGGVYGQGLPGPPMGGPPGGMMHPQGMMGGFDPTYGAAHMGRGGGYGGFASHGHFPGMMPPFAPVGTVGLAGVAPHVNPAFFGRGVAGNGMGMMPNSGMDGQMWGDAGMGAGNWGNDEQHVRRMRESSYGEEMGSEYGYGDMGNERGGRSSGGSREKDRGSDRDWGERRRRDERERDGDWHRDRYRDEKDGYVDRQRERERERDWDNDDGWERERSSKGRSRSRMLDDEDQRSRSKEMMDYSKRRRMQSEHD